MITIRVICFFSLPLIRGHLLKRLYSYKIILTRKGDKSYEKLLSVDIESFPGVISREWWKNNRKRTTDIIIASLTPVIEAVRKVDTDAEITIVVSHSRGENIIKLDFIDYSGLYFINGFPYYMMADLTREYDAVMFVGYHTMAMGHTYSSSGIYNVRINREVVGETALMQHLRVNMKYRLFFLWGKKR